MKKILLFTGLIFQSILSICQNPIPPCGNDYGTSADALNIEQQMRYGTIADAINAIYQAKNTRGYEVGCPQQSLSYSPPDTTEMLLSDVADIWNTVHSPQISAYVLGCPKIGRYENNFALGAYYAMLAGYFSDTSVLADIGNMMEAQQYSSANISAPFVAPEGLYGYINVPANDPCNPGGVVGSGVAAICANFPQYCVTYDNGIFSGENFAIFTQNDSANFFGGDAAYDHGWTGVQMIEAAIQQTDPALKAKFRNSVILAGNWAASENPVRNHNYTAKLIWLLAEVYLWTGDTAYKNALIYKLDKNLIPGILMDLDNDNMVDGMSLPIAFVDLATVAEQPGRMWDGHNSMPWYSAMNAWALTEAYVAFRDRGDTAKANELRPYMLAMNDNLAWEINNLGVVTPNQLGLRDLTYALQIAVWKVAMYESENHPDWYNAIRALWNSGYFNTFNTHSVCVGLYLVIKTNTPYVPLFIREPFTTSIQDNTIENVRMLVFPNPSSNSFTIEFDKKSNDNHTLIIFDGQGRVARTVTGITTDRIEVERNNLNSGQYFFQLQTDDGQVITSGKLIIE